MRRLIACLIVWQLLFVFKAHSDDATIRKGVVKVFASQRSISVISPWKRGSIKSVSGSGVWLGDGRLLTNAHVVLYASAISVQPHESSARIPARTVSISPEMDLAILQLDDASGLAEVTPPPFSVSVPQVRSTVQVYGYPTGGSTQSVTEGIVSRIEYRTYKYGAQGLRIQIDAALNAGNSGGPAIVDGKVVGIVYSRLSSSNNIGYLIPIEEVHTFFADIEDGEYDGKYRLFDRTQSLQNPALREKHGLDSTTTGVLVRDAFSDDVKYPLKDGDIITHLGDYSVDNTGIVRTDHDLRVSFHYLVSRLAANGKVPLTVKRNGESLHLQVPIQRSRELLIPPLKGRYPSYFVYGPIVFSEATSDYLEGIERTLSSTSARSRAAGIVILRDMQKQRSPLLTRRFSLPRFDGEQLVIVSTRLLPHRIGTGYRSPASRVLKSVNGTEIKSMQHLVETLRDLDSPQVAFDFVETNSETLVFNRAELLSVTDDILADNGIARQCSANLKAIWDGEQAASQ